MSEHPVDRAAVETSAHPPKHGITIQDASAWILRIGVIASVITMLTGMVFSFIHHHVPVERMQSDTFDYHPSVIWQGLREGHGKAIIEVGIYLLVLTPIVRVAMSMALFLLVEKDWVYTIVTFLVLVMTIAGLLFLK